MVPDENDNQEEQKDPEDVEPGEEEPEALFG